MAAKRNNKKAGKLARLGIGIAAVALLAISQAAAGPFTDVPDPDDDLTYDADVCVVNVTPMGGPCLGCIDIDFVIARALRAQLMVEWLLRRDLIERQGLSYLQRVAQTQQRASRLLLNLRALREPPD